MKYLAVLLLLSNVEAYKLVQKDSENEEGSALQTDSDDPTKAKLGMDALIKN